MSGPDRMERGVLEHEYGPVSCAICPTPWAPGHVPCAIRLVPCTICPMPCAMYPVPVYLVPCVLYPVLYVLCHVPRTVIACAMRCDLLMARPGVARGPGGRGRTLGSWECVERHSGNSGGLPPPPPPAAACPPPPPRSANRLCP